MSQFSTIQTKLKDRSNLVEALELLQYNVVQDAKLENPLDHEHKQWQVDVAVNDKVGFKWNKNTETYELVADQQTWNFDVPVQRFIDKVTQQYARATIYNTVKEMGLEVAEEWEMDDNSIEITVNRWN